VIERINAAFAPARWGAQRQPCVKTPCQKIQPL